MPALPPIFVDSVYLIAMNTRQDEWRSEAQAAADSMDPLQPLVTSHGVLSETLAHFSRAAPAVRTHLAHEFRRLNDDPLYTVVTLDIPLIEGALDLYGSEFANSTLSFQDCVSILIMREYGITSILTADQEFARAGFTPLLRRFLV